MAITFVGSNTGTADYSVASFNVALPTCQENDIVLVFTSGSTSGSDKALGVLTSGYTELTELYVEGPVVQDQNYSVSWKRMGATPDTTVECQSIQGSNGYATCAVVYVIRGVDQTTALDVAIATDSGTTESQPNPPAITPTTSGALVVIGGASIVSDSAVTPPTGYSNNVSVNVGSGNANTLAVASKLWESGTEDPGAWTDWASSSYTTWIASTLALRPENTPGLYVTLPVIESEFGASSEFSVDMPVFSVELLSQINNVVDVDLPAFTTVFSALGVSGNLVVDLPELSFVAETSAPAWLDVDLPALGAELFAGADFDLEVEPVDFVFSAVSGATTSLNIDLPELSFASATGSNFIAALPEIEVSFEGTTGTVADLNVRLPSIDFSFTADVQQSSRLTIDLPALQTVFTSQQSTLSTLSVELPSLEMSFVGYAGTTTALSVTLPTFTTLLTSYEDISADLLVSLPAMTATLWGSQPGRFDTSTAAELEATILKWRRPS